MPARSARSPSRTSRGGASAARKSPAAKRVKKSAPTGGTTTTIGGGTAAKPKEQRWLLRQRDSFGWPFLICCCTVYFAQGFRSLSALATQFYLKDVVRLEPAAIQALLSAAAVPWSLKPLYGLTSDAFAIFGQHRRPYLVVAALVGVLSWCGLAIVAAPRAGGDDAAYDAGRWRTLWVLSTLLWFSNFSTALSDVIVDAMVAERCGEAARAAEARGDADAAAAGTEGENALQSLCWGSLAVGGLAGSAFGMVASATVPTWVVFVLTASCPALVLLASRALTEPPVAATAAVTGLAAVRKQGAALLGALRQPAIWRPLLFFLLQHALVPSPSQAMLFFQTDVLGFSQAFLSAQSLVGYGFLLVGTAVYSRYVQGAPFIRIFACAQLAAIGMSLLDVLLATRYTHRLGLPDRAFVLGTDAVGTVLDRVSAQPFFVIAARLCPVGCEASLYAFFMSTYNFGNTLSGVFGAALTPLFGVEQGKYEGLSRLLLLRAACGLLPLALLRPLLSSVDRLKPE